MAYIQGICFDLFNALVSVGRIPGHVGPMTAEMWRDLSVSGRNWNWLHIAACSSVTAAVMSTMVRMQPE